MLLFLVHLINIEKLIISFRFFYSFSFILRSRATSVWYQSLTSIRDQVIFVCFKFLFDVFQIIGCLPNFFSPHLTPAAARYNTSVCRVRAALPFFFHRNFPSFSREKNQISPPPSPNHTHCHQQEEQQISP